MEIRFHLTSSKLLLWLPPMEFLCCNGNDKLWQHRGARRKHGIVKATSWGLLKVMLHEERRS